MATTKKQTQKRPPSHALFWTLLKETPGYDPHYKDVIKEGIVHEHSGGRTTSLSEMYAKYPREYSLMIEAMKGTPEQKKARYDSQENNARRRVIAAISEWVDKPRRQLWQLQRDPREPPVGHLQPLLQAQQRGYNR